MSTPGSSFGAFSPIPPQVTQVGYGIFQTPDASSPNEITVPTTYSMFIGQTIPSSSDGVAGDWYQWIVASTGIVRIYQKTDATTWTYITTIPNGTGGGTGDVIGPIVSSDSNITLFDGASGKVIKDSGVKIASSGGTATSSQVPRGNDPRMTNSRVPTDHATTHESGGSDSIKLDALAAPEDVTTLNATTSAHGLLPKLSGITTQYLRGDGTFAVPASSGSGVLCARVSTQFDKTTSAVLANVTGLSVALQASTTYLFEAVLFVDSDATGLAQASVSGTATFTALRYEGQAFGVGTAEIRDRGTAFGSAVAKLQGAVTNGRLQIWGSIVTNAAGTLTIQFSQLTASGTSSVLTGSYLKAYAI